MKKMQLTIIMFLLISSSLGFGTTLPYSTRALNDFKKHCTEIVCEAPYQRVLLYDPSQTVNLLDANLLAKLTDIAAGQTQLWDDNILESDYQVDGKTNVSIVMGLKKNGNLVGYHIEYFQKAWTISDHRAGQIFELSFVTKNLDYAETDTDHMAQFIELGSLQ